MMTPVMDIEMFRKGPDGTCPPTERRRSQKALLWLMEGLCRINQDIFAFQNKLGKRVPALYGSGFKYQREDGQEWWKVGTRLEGEPTELWQDIYKTVARKGGDCEDLACYRIAELRYVYKRPARPFVTYRVGPDGAYHYHALLWAKGPDGWRLEDPSRKMGMGFEEFYARMPQRRRVRIVALMDGVQKKASPRKLRRLREVG